MAFDREELMSVGCHHLALQFGVHVAGQPMRAVEKKVVHVSTTPVEHRFFFLDPFVSLPEHLALRSPANGTDA